MDAATRLRVLTELEKQSGGKLELFFASYGLGDSYAAPSKGWGKAKRIGAAMAAADRRGDGDRVLSAAAEHFGLHMKPDHSNSTTTAGDDPNPPRPTNEIATQTPGGSPESDEQELLRLVFEAWDKTGEWPIGRRLQRKVERDGGRLDVERTGRALDRRLGFLEQKPDGRVVLRVGGLRRCPGAEAYVSAFVAAVRLAYQWYVDSDVDDSPELSDKVVSEELGLDKDMIWRIYGLLDGEPFLLEGGGSNPDQKTFQRHISPDIRTSAKSRTATTTYACVMTSSDRMARLRPSPGRRAQTFVAMPRARCPPPSSEAFRSSIL
jgi:hypothetical protein